MPLLSRLYVRKKDLPAIGFQDRRKMLSAKYNQPMTSGISTRVMDAQFKRLDFDLR